jgi:hypothetical protein
VLRALLAETDLIMAVDGYPTLADLLPEALLPVSGRYAGIFPRYEPLAHHAKLNDDR